LAWQSGAAALSVNFEELDFRPTSIGLRRHPATGTDKFLISSQFTVAGAAGLKYTAASNFQTGVPEAVSGLAAVPGRPGRYPPLDRFADCRLGLRIAG
jgi:hypothetical protein